MRGNTSGWAPPQPFCPKKTNQRRSDADSGCHKKPLRTHALLITRAPHYTTQAAQRTALEKMSPLMSIISRVSALVPIYDFNTAKEYAERLLYTQIILCTFGGALSWAFGGVLQISFGFALAALVGFEVGSVKLLKVREKDRRERQRGRGRRGWRFRAVKTPRQFTEILGAPHRRISL